MHQDLSQEQNRSKIASLRLAASEDLSEEMKGKLQVVFMAVTMYALPTQILRFQSPYCTNTAFSQNFAAPVLG